MSTMKYAVYVMSLLMLAACGSESGEGFGAPTTIEAETTFNFGDVVEGEVVDVTFEVKNTGELPLNIVEVKPACGCTVAEYTKEPILPGEIGMIKSQVNTTGFAGEISKSVTMMANTNPTRTVFLIKGNVLKN